jgi:hypothetical protein
MIPPALRRLVKERACDRCEYCRLPQAQSVLSFHVEHILPRQHGGESHSENLALACPHGNWHKGPNLSGIDPDTRSPERLFHPRQDDWELHFGAIDGLLTGKTAIGRTTIWVLAMNDDDQVRRRTNG